jgi:hypothetical protein
MPRPAHGFQFRYGSMYGARFRHLDTALQQCQKMTMRALVRAGYAKSRRNLSKNAEMRPGWAAFLLPEITALSV